MGKTWVLSTQTKGTGATMVPLDSVTKSASRGEPLSVPPKAQPRPQEPAPPRPPRRFKVVDVMTNETLIDDAMAREAIQALRNVRSVVDVYVYVWQEELERWRMLTFSERHAMWELADRSGSSPVTPRTA
jgi:hypothetical protein